MISKKKRENVFYRDGYKCVLCGSDEHLSIDHIVPKSKGGTDDFGNLCTLCKRCNAEKGNGINANLLRLAEHEESKNDFDFTDLMNNDENA